MKKPRTLIQLEDKIAAAREEQREACALAVADHHVYLSRREPSSDHREPGGYSAAVRATPLDSTPLGDEVRALRARVAELEAQVATLRDDLLAGGWTAGKSQWKVMHGERVRERDEAVAALRGLLPARGMGFGGYDRAQAEENARAILAKYPEGK